MPKCLKCGEIQQDGPSYCKSCRMVEKSFRNANSGGNFTVKSYTYERKQNPDMYHVYFVKSKDQNAIKIGMAKDIVKRVKTLQIGSSSVLHIIGYIPCYKGKKEAEVLERALHQKYDEFNLHGEWFKDTFPIEELDFREWKGKSCYPPKDKAEVFAKHVSKKPKRQRKIVKQAKKKATQVKRHSTEVTMEESTSERLRGTVRAETSETRVTS